MTPPPWKLSKKSSVLVPWPVQKDLYIYEIESFAISKENPHFMLIESGSIVFVRIYTFFSKKCVNHFWHQIKPCFFSSNVVLSLWRLKPSF